jgi:aminopeptidase 2
LIFHEVGHSWFGNLVSIEWWQFLYLKEGFARYLEYCLCDHFHPEWNYWEHFYSEIVCSAMTMDEDIKGTHPIEVPIKKAREIHDIFDMISYGKAASVYRMISNYIGHDKFWPALGKFIREHRFKTVNTHVRHRLPTPAPVGVF